MTLPMQSALRSLLALGLSFSAVSVSMAQTPALLQVAQAGGAPVASARAADNKVTTRSTSIPAQGLFKGDQLSDATKARLTELMMEAIGSRIELALLVPTGPWQIDGAGQGDTQLNNARLQSLRRFLTDRGVDPNRVVVESRIDDKIKTPRLDVQLLTSPAND